MTDVRARVGISLLTLVPGEVGGSETYARSLCRALSRSGTLSYEVIAPLLAPDCGSGLPTRVLHSYGAGAGRRKAVSMAGAYLRPGVRREFAASRYGVVHFPLTVELPRVSGVPTVVTSHDVQHLLIPRFFSRATLAYRRLAYATSIRRADAVIAISAHTAATLVDRLGLPDDRIDVVHLGVDHERFTPPLPGTPRERFVLYPANGWPHKNHGRLLEAMRILRQRDPELRLVLTGAGLERVPREDGVEVRGFVSGDELVRLYRSASALVFPSLYEGFGQPPLEAMACGCPVAAADAASIPEICGDAARLFDPLSPEAIAEAVEDVLGDPERWTAAGVLRARTFSWEETARRTEAVYRRLAPSTAVGVDG